MLVIVQRKNEPDRPRNLFSVSETGFTTLTPNRFQLSSEISNATYNVDMADYTGSPA